MSGVLPLDSCMLAEGIAGFSNIIFFAIRAGYVEYEILSLAAHIFSYMKREFTFKFRMKTSVHIFVEVVIVITCSTILHRESWIIAWCEFCPCEISFQNFGWWNSIFKSGLSFKINADMNCKTQILIYYINCPNCKENCIGKFPLPTYKNLQTTYQTKKNHVRFH